MSLTPNQQQMTDFLNSDVSGEIVMCNLLKFADPQEYARYERLATAELAKVGGRITWIGMTRHLLVGQATDEWDAIALVTYPSREAFLAMATNPEYQPALAHREKGLSKTALICCTSMPIGADTESDAGER